MLRLRRDLRYPQYQVDDPAINIHTVSHREVDVEHADLRGYQWDSILAMRTHELRVMVDDFSNALASECLFSEPGLDLV